MKKGSYIGLGPGYNESRTSTEIHIGGAYLSDRPERILGENSMVSKQLSPSPPLSEVDLKPGRTAVIVTEGTVGKGSAGAATNDTTFLRAEGEEGYIPIDKYEGRHRWDPNFEWEPDEEKKIVRRIDYRICSWCCLAFFALQLDRANIIQALTDNFLDDLGLNTNDYNYGQTM